VHVQDYNFDHPGTLCACYMKVCCFLIFRKLILLSFWFLSSADAFNTDQLLECMGKLKSGQSVNITIYDFKNHRCCSESFRKVVIV
jgi:hypothetical protein